MPGRVFDDLTDLYEAMIDWPKRLDHEAPFYRRLFEEHRTRSVFDAACGTGRHAAMFHSWGLRVEGADVSPGMIARARASFGEPEGLHWAVRGFEAPAGPEAFDAAICVGNSLALAADAAAADRAIARLLEAVRGGGVAVVHVLNLWRLPEGPCVWQKCKRARLPQGEMLVVKGVHRCGDRGLVDLLVLDPAAEAMAHHESVTFLGLDRAMLERAARHAGATRTACFGGYRGEPYDPPASIDLLMVAEK
jgi:SAM-dependent methyltransferase